MRDFSKVFNRKAELLQYLDIKDAPVYDNFPQFPMRVPLSYAKKIKKGDENDPLLKQILPTIAEREYVKGFTDDPVGDVEAGLNCGIEQKYEGRILLIAGNACSIKCRYCFRRNEECRMPPNLAEKLSKYLKEKGNIKEVILSGGDPCITKASVIENLFNVASKAKSVKTMRIHTRVPLTEPLRMEPYIHILKNFKERFQLVIVLHTNHANELEGDTPKIIAQLRELGVHMLNQSVLLKGINDSVETLANLSEKLFQNGVLPYYLHQLDHAKGVAHFEIDDAKALEIMEGLRKALPGYLVPRLVREIKGEKSKTPIINA